MTLSYIGPTIAIAVNLPLAIWALVKEGRNPAYRVFALLAASLVIWNLGGEVFYHGGASELWQRLSFFGMALAPANFLCLALLARKASSLQPDPAGPSGAYWQFLLYVPAAALGLALNPAVIAQNPVSHSWHAGFYSMSQPETLLFAGMTAVYLIAALWISWRAGRKAPEGEDWPFYLVQLPFAAGALCVIAVAYLHSERAPTVSLWAMVMSQYAMYLMIRNGLVRLELSIKRAVTLTFSAIVLAACVLLGFALIRVLFEKTFTREMSLILVVSIVALCVLYAALVPRLEEFLDAVFHRDRKD